jgi:serine protease SohB
LPVLIVNLTQRKRQRGELRITRLSEQYKEMQEEMSLALLGSLASATRLSCM